jgi:hypothetical protein
MGRFRERRRKQGGAQGNAPVDKPGDVFGDAAMRWNAAMERGNFEVAWQQIDRLEIPRRAAQLRAGFVRHTHHLKWNGEPFEGRNVLVRCEHGLGDTLQFVRYLPLIQHTSRSLTLLVQPPLLALLQATPGLGDVRNGWSGHTPMQQDVEVEIMELPYVFRSTLQTLPRLVPYLDVAPLLRLQTRLPPLDGGGELRVGLAWSASDWDETRSVPLEALSPLGVVPGVRFYSLQQGSHAAAYARAPFALEPYSRHTGAVELAAAAMLGLDLVITVDSMVAHLAGALGRPVWLLLKRRADWRWMDARVSTPWYPTMRLFRQQREGDWCGVAAAVATMLADVVARR